MDALTVRIGFEEHERAAVAALYWEAFRRKLRPAFTSDAVGRAFVTAAVRPARFIVARVGASVVGVCGFHEQGHGAVDASWGSLRRRLSVTSSLRAALVLAVLDRTDSHGVMVLDGICVDEGARGRGIGTALLEAAAAHARAGGRRSVRLSVVDTNPRAAALYRRVGYRATSSGSLGLLGFLYGFDGWTTMEQQVRR